MKTHYYGGLKKYQWLARPLALHGTIVDMDGRVIPVCIGEDEDDPVFTVLDLLPHLARKQREETVEKAFVAEKLNIAIGHEPAATDEDAKVRQRVLELLFERYAIREEDLYSAELQIVPAGKARFVGLDRALLGGYGQDDRLCVFAAFKAFMDAPKGEHTQILLLWDKEEIGSDGATGAKSRFMEYALADILDAWEPATRLRHVLGRTKAVSADVHCPMDPDYQDVHDKYNASLLGFGPVFSKFTGHGGKYGASEADCEYVAWFRALLAAENIPWQMAEMGKVDEGGGGTVAKELAVYGMEIIDFGPGVLSMHSPFRDQLQGRPSGHGAGLQRILARSYGERRWMPDRRHHGYGRTYRPRQDEPHQGADRHQLRPAGRGAEARHHHRAGLRLPGPDPADPARHHRRAGSRALREEHGRRGRGDRLRAAGHRRRRGHHAPDPRASGNLFAAGHPGRAGGPDQDGHGRGGLA
jgi:aspartyl aminopeptidase